MPNPIDRRIERIKDDPKWDDKQPLEREHADDCPSLSGETCGCIDPRVFELRIRGLPIPDELAHLDE